MISSILSTLLTSLSHGAETTTTASNDVLYFDFLPPVVLYLVVVLAAGILLVLSIPVAAFCILTMGKCCTSPSARQRRRRCFGILARLLRGGNGRGGRRGGRGKGNGGARAEEMTVSLLDEDFSPELNDAIVKASPQLHTMSVSIDDLVMEEQIGVGSSSQVFRARHAGASVAVKRCLIIDLLDDPLQDFMKESTLMSALRHRNVVRFIGATIRSPHFYIISEYCTNGSVDKMISVNSTLGEDSFNERKTVNLDLYAKVRIMFDTAQGMAFLSTRDPPVVHRDLKLANLLVDSEWTTKIGDFGVSRMVESARKMTMVGTIETSAPEVLQFSVYSVKSDVFSFGVMLYELIFEQPLYEELSVYEVMRMVVQDDLRPTIPETFMKGYPITEMNRLISVMKACWQAEPEKRPPFDAIAQEMGYILSKLKPKPCTPFHGAHSSMPVSRTPPAAVITPYNFEQGDHPTILDMDTDEQDASEQV